MIYLGNPCGNPAVIAAMQSGEIGFIATPLQGNARPPGSPWCANNGCFSDKWEKEKW